MMAPIRMSPHFRQDAWNEDKSFLTPSNQAIAQGIFDFATQRLRSEVHHRPKKNEKSPDRETIFRVEGVEGFWLVINTSRGKLKLVFPDKGDQISSIKGVEVGPAQWEKKREKRGVVAADDGIEALAGINDTIELIHSNALDYYTRTADFTVTLRLHLGAPVGGISLRVPDIATFREILQQGAGCTVCGSPSRLSCCLHEGEWRLFCDAHLAQMSPWMRVALKGVPFDVRKHVWHRDGGKCVVCGSERYMTFDHVIPANRGGKYPFTGSNLESNIRLRCRKCNGTKGDSLIP